MKQTQEFNGKNIDAAIEKACSELNVSKKQLVYDVISSGSSGIFGIVGVKKARIRVTLPEKKSRCFFTCLRCWRCRSPGDHVHCG